jgi:hypothetical protein
MKLFKLAVLVPVAVLNISLVGCGGMGDESSIDSSRNPEHYLDISHMDSATREEFLANHKHEREVSAQTLADQVDDGGEKCYCSYCQVHHAPHCL